MPTFKNSTTGTDNAIVGYATDGRGVEGWSDKAYGMAGDSKHGAGVRGTSDKAPGVEGWSTEGAGVFGTSTNGFSIHGHGGRLAGLFEGDVQIDGGLIAAGVNVNDVLHICQEPDDIASHVARTGTTRYIDVA